MILVKPSENDLISRYKFVKNLTFRKIEKIRKKNKFQILGRFFSNSLEFIGGVHDQ